MTRTSIIDFDRTLDIWIDELEKYSFPQLIAKPADNSWSMGQLYMHLIEATGYSIKQVHRCTSSDDNMDGEAFTEAKTMFSNNDFPDVLLDGPPSNAMTQQPGDREQLVKGLASVKDQMNDAAILAEQTPFKGRVKHFGLGYFTAGEWIQFAEMHLRHHLRQKKRLDEFLKHNNIH